ncbi:MAG: hypothetical protein J6U14_00185 [Bacteroidaceae bacterium]|nr:hypothetical protein [Bacteroidaceae bacterium]
MKKYIEISAETLERLETGKYVAGSLQRDKETGKLVFTGWKRSTKKRNRDKTICRLEHGWLKESAERYKFYNSVDKAIGVVQVANAMSRELEFAMEELFLLNIND